MSRWLLVSTLLSAVMVLAGPVPSVRAGSWPQILGPHRNGVAENEDLIDSLPADGPPVVWQREVGSGFAGLAVASGRAVLFHRVGNREVVEAMDPATGRVLWKADFPARYRPSYTRDDGPRCVPLIADKRVIVYGAMGDLRCLDLETGKEIWAHQTFDEFNSGRPFRGEPPEGYFGVGTTPIVVGDRVLVNVGGDTKQAGLVAFSLEDGTTLWKATSERASYSSPIARKLGEHTEVIFVTRLSVVSVSAENGAVRFTFPFGRAGPTVNAASPVLMDGHLFVTASYGIGAKWAKLTDDGAEVLWSSDDILSSQYTTPIAHQGKLYGIDGRQDVGIASLRCIEPATRTIHWSKDDFGYATLLLADGKLLAMTTDGELVFVEPTPQRYVERGRARLFTGTVRALPALADGLLYARDTDTLKCFDLRAAAEGARP